MLNRIVKRLLKIDWSGEGAAFLASRVHENPQFKRYFMRRMFGKLLPSLRPKRKKAWISNSLRKQVFERDSYRCQHCGGWHNLSIDHIYPESKGGRTEIGNLQTLCMPCNMKKGANEN